VPKLDYRPEAPMALTVAQTAEEMQIGLNRAYELVEAKVIPSFRISDGNIRVPRDLLRAWCIARALEETYGDGAGGYRIPPILARFLAGTIADDEAGSPPRAWGRRRPTHRHRRGPAVHPHARGDDCSRARSWLAVIGSPPRAWGRRWPV